MSEFKTSENQKGNIQIADDVIAIIASTAALEVEGVRGIASAAPGFFGMKNQAKGVKITFEESDVCVDIEVNMVYGAKIHVVATEIQAKIKNAIETMTGLCVATVNVSVLAVINETEETTEETV